MDESQMHDAKWKNPHTENIHTLWFCLYDNLERQEYRNRKHISGFQRPGVRRESEYKGQHEGILWDIGIVLYSVCDGFKNLDTCKNPYTCTMIFRFIVRNIYIWSLSQFLAQIAPKSWNFLSVESDNKVTLRKHIWIGTGCQWNLPCGGNFQSDLWGREKGWGLSQSPMSNDVINHACVMNLP